MSAVMRGRRLISLLIFLLTLFLFINLASPVSRYFYPFHYRQIIVEQAGRYDLEPQLVAAVIRVESNFKKEAESKKGARGLMQIMPETGVWAAEMIGMDDYEEDELFDPLVNVSLGSWYLQHLYCNFDNNMYAALAAYNGGQSHVKHWLKEGIWDGSRENLSHIPFIETRNFVVRVEMAYRRYQRLYNIEDL